MADARIEHVYDCDEDTFWNKVFLDSEYNRRLFKEALGFPVYDEVKREERDDQVKRVIEVVPKTGDMPAALKKLVGENIGYREEGVLDKKARRYRVTVIPNRLADKLTITGELFTEPVGEKKCRRVYKAHVEARVFGLGGLIEKRVIADIENGYSLGAKFTNQYIAEKKL